MSRVTLSRPQAEVHRKLGAEGFHRAWELLDDPDRDEAGDARMLDAAHASRYHWGIIGGPRERAIADWQVARVYAAINEPALSLRFAELSLAECREHRLLDLLASAHEGIARAHGVAGRTRLARDALRLARESLDAATVSAEDRRTYLAQIRDTERKIG